MEHRTQPGGAGKTLFLFIASVIVASLLLFLILRPGHALPL
jgi:hypothetical protein